MKRIIIDKNRDYTTISNVFLKDKNLSLKAKGFLAIIMSLPDTWDFSIKGMQDVLKENKDAIYSCVNELKCAGYCKTEQQNINGRFSKFVYVFSETPLAENPHTENPHTENPHTENPHTENPHTENPTQLITYNNKVSNGLSTKKSKEESSIKDSLSTCVDQETITPQNVIDLFNEIISINHSIISRINSLKKNGKTWTMFMARLKEYGYDIVKETFEKAAKSPFLNGSNSYGWKASFFWIVRPNNFEKVHNGNYDSSSDTDPTTGIILQKKDEHKYQNLELW